MSSYKLPYLRDDTVETQTMFGYNVMTNLEKYNGTILRDKVVFRVDMLYGISSIYSRELVGKFRNVLFSIMSGAIRDKEQIAMVLRALYDTGDSTFRKYLGEVVYFSDKTKERSLYSNFILDARDAYERAMEECKLILSEQGVKYLFESKGFLYFSIPDVSSLVIELPTQYKEEIVSYAKNWKGNFSRT